VLRASERGDSPRGTPGAFVVGDSGDPEAIVLVDDSDDPHAIGAALEALGAVGARRRGDQRRGEQDQASAGQRDGDRPRTPEAACTEQSRKGRTTRAGEVHLISHR